MFFDRVVAIKEFFPKDFCGRDNTSHLTLGTQNNAETVEKLKARFLKEAKNIAKLDHNGIVRIHDIFEENNTAYYVMDYIDGESLSEMVKRVGPLSESKAIEYIRKVGDALDYIHSRNMTHFDVKPANIMIRRKDDAPILIDFGLSKQYDIHGDATSTLMQGVSQGYSPLELYSAGCVSSFSPQTDVYSLGATLYYLVTGNIPPIASDIIDNGLQLPSIVSSAVSNAISCAMTISRAKRPSCVSTFLDKLTVNCTEKPKHNTSAENVNSNEDTVLIDDPKDTHSEQSKQTAPKATTKEATSRKYSGCIWTLVAICFLIIVGAVFLTDDLTPEINTIDQNVEYENLEEVELKEEKDVLIETVKEETTQNKKYSEKIDSKLDKIPSKSNSSNMLDENKTMIVDDNHIFNLAETPGLEAPQFPGGEEALLKYISENIRYPAEAIENNIQGRVVVQFVVTKTGAVSEVRVLRGKYPDIDREAVRVVKSFPKFIPGRMNGHAVNVWYSLPIQFKLSGI